MQRGAGHAQQGIAKAVANGGRHRKAARGPTVRSPIGHGGVKGKNRCPAAQLRSAAARNHPSRVSKSIATPHRARLRCLRSLPACPAILFDFAVGRLHYVAYLRTHTRLIDTVLYLLAACSPPTSIVRTPSKNNSRAPCQTQSKLIALRRVVAGCGSNQAKQPFWGSLAPHPLLPLPFRKFCVGSSEPANRTRITWGSAIHQEIIFAEIHLSFKATPYTHDTRVKHVIYAC